MPMIDLSATISPSSPATPDFLRTEMSYNDHRSGAAQIQALLGVPASLLRDQEGWATETLTRFGTHDSTHVDAPWHYGPTSEGGAVAKTIDECPLEWFYGDGVRLDLRHKEAGDRILVEDLENALDVIGHVLSPGEIVMLWTGRDKFLGSEEYFEQPGMTRESTLWLCERGIKVIGIDAYGFDRKFADMADEARETGDATKIWEAHFAGLEREYCQIEKLVNLDLLPRATGFQVSCFPIKVEGASGGWSRVVAFV